MIRMPLFLSLCLVFPALSLPAVQTEEWADEGFRQFIQGELHNISLHVDGLMQSAPALALISELPEPIVWTAAMDPDGRLAFGTGNQGRVLRLDSGTGTTERVFHSGEVMVRALAFDSEGRLYAGTSPRGQVHRIPADGRPELYFLPEESYVWDMVFDAEDNLYVAVGSPARIYRIPPDHDPGDEAEAWFSAGQRHFTTLAWDAQGRLLAGSAPDGILYRIRGRGEAEALYQSDAEEIKAIVPEASGSVLFSTYASGSPRNNNNRTDQPVGSAEPIVMHVRGDRRGENEREEQAEHEERGRATVLRLRQDGRIERVWEPDRGGIFSLLPLKDGTFLAGGQEKGRIYRVRRSDDWSLLQQAENGGEVSILIAEPESGAVVAVTSNPARVYRLEEERASAFRYDSRVHDARRSSTWGRVHLIAPAGVTAIAVETRSGNTGQPDETWSAWVEAEATPSGHRVQSPPARFLQYRLRPAGEEARAETSEAIEVRRVRGFFRAPNEAPVITHLRVFPVGFQLIRQEPDQTSADFDQLLRSSNPDRYFDGPRVRRQLRPVMETGHVTAIWRAVDPNENRLVYRVYIKPVEEPDWRLVAERLDDAFYSFNARGYDDGYYHFKIVASDLPDNDPDDALESTRLSPVFLIDNAPPRLSVTDKRVEDGAATLRIRAEDAHSILTRADYRLNGGERIALRPIDGLFDRREASFEIVLEDLREGMNTLTVEISDERENSSVLSLTIRI